MTLKSIEMQVAIPRTGDAGNLQNQLLQKPVHDQAMLAAATMKQREKQRKTSNKVDETLSEQLKADQDGNKSYQQMGQNKSTKKTKEKHHEIEHPYKGHHIDLSL